MKTKFIFGFGLFVAVIAAVTFFSRSSKPRLSIITSLWNGDQFIEGFMENITSQTIFSECELIIINAKSPGHEESVIQPYLKRYPNIKYLKLDQDPGPYGTWNKAIQLASSDLIANANLDDRSRRDAYEVHVAELEAHPEIDLVYSGYYLSIEPNMTFETGTFETDPDACSCDPPEFTIKNTVNCLAGPRPVWRKSLHKRFGYFDETFTVVSDWAFWARVASCGAKFKKIPGFYTIYYLNPDGVSTPNDSHRQLLGRLEGEYIMQRYGHLWDTP